MRRNSTFYRFSAVLVYWLWGGLALHAQTLDPAFQPTTLRAPFLSLIQSGVNVLAVQSDDKVLVAGGFDYVNGALSGKLQRLNPNGTTDATFNAAGLGANAFISALLLQPDGKILVGGGFTTFNGQALPMVVRLNANGTPDTGFTFATASSIRQIASLALQPDGKILVGSGNDQLSASGPPTGGLVRLLPTGALDPTFNIGSGVTTGGLVSAILVQADERIVVGGGFNDFNGQALRYLVRLLPTGALDPDFAYNTAPVNATVVNSVTALAQQADGLLLVASAFSQNGGQTVQRVARLLPDGTMDGTFQPGTAINGSVRSLALDAGGNVLIGGVFTSVNGVSRNRVARLTDTGALDPTYGDPIGANNAVNKLTITPAGQVLVGGIFTQYGPAASPAGLVRLGAGTGALDNAFAPVIEARGTLNQAVPLANGQLLVAGNFTQFNGVNAAGTAAAVRRVNADGTLDAGFGSQATGTGLIQAVQPNGSFYLVGTQLSTSSMPSFLQRLLGTGAVDAGFTAAPFGPTSAGGTFNSAQLQGTVAQPNGRLLVFGRFTSYGGLTGLSGVVRLNADGTPDNTFVPPAGAATRRIVQVLTQPSGKLLLVSDDNNTPGTTLVRLNANGTADNTFSAGTAAGPGAFYSVLLQADGRLLVSGSFTSFNGRPAPYGLARLTVDGTPDPTFSGLTAPYSLRAVQPDGRLLAIRGAREAGELVRLNADGSLDSSFGPVATPQSIFSGDDIVTGVVLQPADGKIILFGSFRYVAGQVRMGLARLTNVGLSARAAVTALPLHAYPNPAHAAVTVALPAVPRSRPAMLLDLQGRVVRRWLVPAQQAETRLSLDAAAPGVYLLQVQDARMLYQRKIEVMP